MRDWRTTSSRRASGGLLKLLPIASRVLAQVIVVGLWWGGMSSQGVNPDGATRFSGALWFAAIPTVPPAIVIGALDGVGWGMRTSWRPAVWLRVGAPLLLVVYSLIWMCPVWMCPVGILATATSFYVAPAMPTYLGALAGMELALAAELLTFVAVTISVRLFLWQRGYRQHPRVK